MLIRSSADRRGAGGAEGAKERINTEERSSGDERSWFFDRLGWRVRRGLTEQIVEGLTVLKLRSVTTHYHVHQAGATYPDARFNDREDGSLHLDTLLNSASPLLCVDPLLGWRSGSF